MNNRIDICFSELKAKKRAAFIAFITAGAPEPQITVPVMHALVKGGSDILELGVPFSDPSADGTTIQAANERALAHDVGILDVLDMVKEFRAQDTTTPVVLMGYLNPIENLGAAKFADLASRSGVDGLITVDLPPEESSDFAPVIKQHGIYPVYLIAPTSTDTRIKAIANLSQGFVYYVSVKGVTGTKAPDYKQVKQQLARIRSITDLPIAVGFGIKDATGVTAVGKLADAVVVGSAIVEVMSVQNDVMQIAADVENFIKSIAK